MAPDRCLLPAFGRLATTRPLETVKDLRSVIPPIRHPALSNALLAAATLLSFTFGTRQNPFLLVKEALCATFVHVKPHATSESMYVIVTTTVFPSAAAIAALLSVTHVGNVVGSVGVKPGLGRDPISPVTREKLSGPVLVFKAPAVSSQYVGGVVPTASRLSGLIAVRVPVALLIVRGADDCRLMTAADPVSLLRSGGR